MQFANQKGVFVEAWVDAAVRAGLPSPLATRLVAGTMAGSAALTRVVEARSRVGQVNATATSEILNNPQQFAEFQEYDFVDRTD